MDYNDAMKMHMGIIGGHTEHGVSKYSYVVNQEDLTNAYLQMRSDLGYPLMIDSKYRRAIVYNKEGIEKKINDMINECIIANIKELENMIIEDIVSNIESQLNGITQASNGTVSVGNRNRIGRATNRFARSLAKGLVKGVGKIIDDMTNPKEKR